MSSEALPTWEQFDALYARIERAEAALAVAREREQRLREALLALAWDGGIDRDGQPCWCEGTPHSNECIAARAALVDEPAAATLAEPGAVGGEPTRSCAKPTRGIYGVRSRCARPLGHFGDCDSIWNYRDWTLAAADEPGETPA